MQVYVNMLCMLYIRFAQIGFVKCKVTNNIRRRKLMAGKNRENSKKNNLYPIDQIGHHRSHSF